MLQKRINPKRQTKGPQEHGDIPPGLFSVFFPGLRAFLRFALLRERARTCMQFRSRPPGTYTYPMWIVSPGAGRSATGVDESRKAERNKERGREKTNKARRFPPSRGAACHVVLTRAWDFRQKFRRSVVRRVPTCSRAYAAWPEAVSGGSLDLCRGFVALPFQHCLSMDAAEYSRRGERPPGECRENAHGGTAGSFC